MAHLCVSFVLPEDERESVMDIVKDEQPRAVAGSRSLKFGSTPFSCKSLCRPVQVTLQRVGTLQWSCWLSRVGNTALRVGASSAQEKK